MEFQYEISKNQLPIYTILIQSNGIYKHMWNLLWNKSVHERIDATIAVAQAIYTMSSFNMVCPIV